MQLPPLSCVDAKTVYEPMTHLPLLALVEAHDVIGEGVALSCHSADPVCGGLQVVPSRGPLDSRPAAARDACCLPSSDLSGCSRGEDEQQQHTCGVEVSSSGTLREHTETVHAVLQAVERLRAHVTFRPS